MDKKAINYNPNANLNKVKSCVYKNLGCTDKNAVNYNKWANVACSEDCIGSTNSNCEFTESCSSTPQNICKYNVLGCSREWANNYNNKAITDNNSCSTIENFMSRIVILSGGSCNGCSNKVYVKIDNDYVINGGYDGINMVVLDRNIDIITNKITVRYIKHFNTGVTTQESNDFVSFCQNYLNPSDVVIIAVKSDFIGQFDDSLKQVISLDAQNILKLLGAQKYETVPKSSYILIGSLLLDYYYESTNTNRDAYYPLFNLVNIGCINIYDPKFVKQKLNIDTHLMLTTLGLETDEFIWRCALEAHSNGYDIFMIKGYDCYGIEELQPIVERDEIVNIYKQPEVNNTITPITNKFKSAYARSYLLNNYMAGTYEKVNSLIESNIDGSICGINQFYQTYGNFSTENYYIIVDAFHSGHYLNDFASLYTYIYTGTSFTGLKSQLETGIQSATKIFTSNKVSTDGFELLTIESMKVPMHHYVIVFKSIYTDPKLNNNDIPEYYMFSGPSTTDITKNINYKEYGAISKEQKYPTKISTLLIINGFMGINLFQGSNYTDLVFRVGYGKYIIPDIYITPYYSKIKNMISQIITDLKLVNFYVDQNGNDITFQTVTNIFAQNLPYNAQQINAILINIFKSLNYVNYDQLADKYTTLVDGFNVKSIKSYIRANACIRFFSDNEFNNLIYTYYIARTVYGKPYDETNNINLPSLAKSIIVDKLGLIQIYYDLNKSITYYELEYSDLQLNTNYISVNNFTEKDLQTFIDPRIWNGNISLDNDVSIVRLKSFFDNDNVDVWFFINNYKSLYEQFRITMFNTYNLIGDDLNKLFVFNYYSNELTTDIPNPIVTINIDDFDVPIMSGKTIKMSKFNNITKLYDIEETLLINNKYDSYFYSGTNNLVYLGPDNATNIFIAILPINGEMSVINLINNTLASYNTNIQYGMLELKDTNNNSKFYQISSSYIYDGNQYIDWKSLSLVSFKQLTIYNLSYESIPLINITKHNLQIIYGIYGGIVIKTNDGNFKKHIPIFKNMFWNNYQWVPVPSINQFFSYDDNNLFYYDLFNKDLNAKIICPVYNNIIDNINDLIILNDIINKLTVPCKLMVYYSPWDDDELFDQFSNYQTYTLKNYNNNIIFYSGIKMIAVNGGNWKITFEHELNSNTSITSVLYIPSPNNTLVEKYDHSVYNGNVILNYQNNILIDTVTLDDSQIYNHILGVKKYDISGQALEPIYIDYDYKLSRWLIKMPLNLPTKKVLWTRFYYEQY
jgi:hypothetical protein